MSARLWVDTDLALGAPFGAGGDVDDGYALAALLRADDTELLGVSAVFGNTDQTTAARCTQALLRAAGSTLTVTPGASRAGEMTAAAEVISALPAGAHVLALGPLTNVAQALARDPSLAERITVHAVGGNLSSRGRWAPYWPFEFNLAKDPDAARAVFDAPMPRRVSPLDVCRRLTVSPSDLSALAASSPLGSYLVRGSRRWRLYAPLRYGALAFPLWDLVPALDVLGLLGGRSRPERVRVRGRGQLVRDDTASETVFTTHFDATAALRAFQRLLSTG